MSGQAVFCLSTAARPAVRGFSVLAVQTTDQTAPAQSGLAPIDWLIIAAYATGTIFLGWYYSRQQTSEKEYFTGTGQMNPMLIGVSLFATLLSTISYLSMPGESLGKGPTYMLSLLAMPVVFLFVGLVLLPVYMKHRVTSAYELLENRLGPEIRTLGAVMFIVLRLAWMSLLIYLTSKAMTTMLGFDDSRIPVIAIITGLVAVIYTSLGGLRAVVITDFVQTILLFGGALLVLATVTWNLGGFGWVPTQWNPNWDTQPVFSTDVSTRVTLVGTLLNYFVWYACTLGGDQTSVQRFMATVDAKAARRALATQLGVNALVSVTLGFVGFSLLGYFQAFPERLPEHISLSDNADLVFPHFIAFELPPVISGLVVAAMFAAAMSSIDSGVNSITAVVVTDLMKGRSKAGSQPPTQTALSSDSSEVSGAVSEQEADRSDPYATPSSSGQDVAVPGPAGGKSSSDRVVTARWMAFAIGAFVVTASSAMGAIPGNITAVTTKTANLLTTPIFGLFFFALFVPFASKTGVIIGTVCGTATAVLIAFSGPIFGFIPGTELDPVSFQWIAPAAITVDIVTGCIASLIFPGSRPEKTT